MTASLENKVALVTGSGRGIGKAIAEELARRGAQVAVNDLNGEWAESTASAIGAKAIPVAGDVSRSQEVHRIVEDCERRLGSIDILINNAGVDKAVRLPDMDEAEWDRIIGINLKSVFLCTKAVLPGMIAKGSGRVISMSSIVARQGAMNGGIHYASSKAAILGFTKTLARQHAADGITANAIAPGVIDTDLIAEHVSPQMRKKIEASIPLGALGAKTDIGATAAFLASDDAAYITGATVDVNGGFWMG